MIQKSHKSLSGMNLAFVEWIFAPLSQPQLDALNFILLQAIRLSASLISFLTAA